MDQEELKKVLQVLQEIDAEEEKEMIAFLKLKKKLDKEHYYYGQRQTKATTKDIRSNRHVQRTRS